MRRPNKKISRETIIFVSIWVVLIGFLVLMGFLAAGCEQSDKVRYNLKKQADNFNIVRRITVINCIKGDVIFQMTGKMSIEVDETEDQLEVTVEDGGSYQIHYIGLSDNVTYVIEDLNLGANEVSNYKYTLVYNPEMWIPVDGPEYVE